MNELVCIRMTPTARKELANDLVTVEFYPWLSKHQRAGAWFKLAPPEMYKYQRMKAFPPASIEKRTVGVRRRESDGRWCWEVRP